MALDNIKKTLKTLRNIISGNIDTNTTVSDDERLFMESVVQAKRKLKKEERKRLIEIVSRFEKTTA